MGLSRLLIQPREVAVRIMRTASEMGITTMRSIPRMMRSRSRAPGRESVLGGAGPAAISTSMGSSRSL
jgi:hypothetical protein